MGTTSANKNKLVKNMLTVSWLTSAKQFITEMRLNMSKITETLGLMPHKIEKNDTKSNNRSRRGL